MTASETVRPEAETALTKAETAPPEPALPEAAPSATVLPDEGRLAFPETWKRFAQPRRGHGKTRRIKLDPQAGREFLAHHEERVRKRLELEANREYAAAGRAYLDGTADVSGAAVIAALARPAMGGVGLTPRPIFDVVATDHGLPFAFAALAESLTLEPKQTAPDNGVGLHLTTLTGQRWSKLQGNKELREIRTLLAGLPDADYAAVIAALAAHRTTPEHRLAVSLLAPAEQSWIDETCAELSGLKVNEACPKLLLEVITTGSQLHDLDLQTSAYSWVQANEVADLLHRLGGDALPYIERHLGGYNYGNEKKTLFRALAAMPTDAALAAILDRLDDPAATTFAMEAAANFPKRTLRTVAARLPEAGRDERKRLSALLYSDPVLLDVALPQMDEEVRAAIATLTAANLLLPPAPDDALPKLLAAPPWEAKGPKRKAVVIKGLVPPAINRLVWAGGEYEAWSEAECYGLANYRSAGRDWEKEAREFDDKRTRSQAFILAFAPMEIGVPLLARWKTDKEYFELQLLQRIVANLGPDAVEQVAAASAWDAALREVLLPIANLTAARLAADALARLKSMRPFAFKWLDRHAADAAALLIPDALAKTKKPRAAAEAALRYLAAAHGADLVREAAVQYGGEAAAAIAELVDLDPLAPVGVKVPSAGMWASPAALPQVLLAGREQGLSHAATRHLITVLALGTPDYDYPGIAIVAESCDRASLARFSLALFEQWLIAGAPSDDGWALTQLAHFADDEAVRVLGSLVAVWPGENQHHRAVKGLQVLGAIGTETALRAINQIAEKAKFAAIKAEAGEQIEAIAANLGLTGDQLADRLVPDFGLRDESALVLDYGPRQFRVGFDEALKPFVSDMDGKPRKSLPKPGAKDDEMLADAAYKRYAALRKDLRTVAADQVKRLERAMVNGRTWTYDEFDEHFVRHPLVWHVARRLVWTADTGDGPVAFRLAEDKGCTDVDEEELHLPETAVIRLAHPALMGETVDAWAEIFADYEILQPFEQLNRPVHAFTDEELRTGRLTRFEGLTVPIGKLLGLTGKGWDRAAPQDAGVEPGMMRWLNGVGYIVIDLDPGIWIGSIDQCPDQTLRQVVVASRDLRGWDVPKPKEAFGPVDPVVASEALAALVKATGVA